MGLSLGVGFLSSLLGIGGGIIHVPVMANLLHFPVHVATATSHFTLAIMTLAGVGVHGLEGDFTGVFGRIVPLAIGVAAGAQAGAGLARWVGGVWIIRALVAALAFVSVRLIVLGWQGGWKSTIVTPLFSFLTFSLATESAPPASIDRIVLSKIGIPLASPRKPGLLWPRSKGHRQVI